MSSHAQKPKSIAPPIRFIPGRFCGRHRRALSRPTALLAALVMLALVLTLFGDVLFLSGNQYILSMFGSDLSDQFVYSRYFAFQEIRRGNLPLWNPYAFCGVPFLGLFQDALLYPLSCLFLILPLAAAINWSIVLHVFLLGMLTYLWAGYSDRSPPAALLAGFLAMFGGTTYLHVFAGHLSLIYALPWAVPILMALDGAWAFWSAEEGVSQRRTSWPLWGGVGAISVCLQVLAGHPQTVFVTAVAAGLYAVCKVAGDVRKWRLLLFLAVIYSIGGILSAVQLAAGLAANMDSIRGEGVYYRFAAMFSFPPENFLTMIIPGFFGDMYHLPYWGRCYIWEMNLFVSVTGFVLLVAGVVESVRSRRLAWLAVTGILIALALGKNTPLFKLLYTYAPGFDLFRGSSKFMIPALLFMAMLAASGYDRIGYPGEKRWLALACMGIGSLLLIGAFFLWMPGDAAMPGRFWQELLGRIAGTKEGYLPELYYHQNRFLSDAAWLARKGLLTGGALFLIIGLLFMTPGKTAFAKHVIFFMMVGELVVFARHYKPYFDINRSLDPDIRQVASSLQPGERILNINRPAAGMRYGVGDLWGSQPGIRRRYAELMAVSQGYDPQGASHYLSFKKASPVFAMLGCKAVVDKKPDGSKAVTYLPSPLPRAFLAGEYKVMRGRDDILRYITSCAFNPLREVVLESEPDPMPRVPSDGLPAGDVTVLNATTDSIDLAVNATKPAILVVTDTFSQGWKAVSLEKTARQNYVIMPANYALRAIPLREGRHKIRLIYQPPLIKAGLAVSAGGWALFLVIWPLMLIRSRARAGIPVRAVIPDTAGAPSVIVDTRHDEPDKTSKETES